MTLPISASPEGQRAVAAEIFDRFQVSKLWGKEPEVLESTVRVFQRDLGGYPADLVLKAIQTHFSRSSEFPSSADIIGLIRRNGRPPLKESDIITIRKKDGEFRTPAEWQMLREWDAQQQESWGLGDAPMDAAKQEATVAENIRLRQQLKAEKEENARLRGLLRQERERRPPAPTAGQIADRRSEEQRQRIERTAQMMLANGDSPEIVEAWKNSQAGVLHKAPAGAQA